MGVSYGTSVAVWSVRKWSVFCQAEDGIRDLVRSRGLGDVYKRQVAAHVLHVQYSGKGFAVAFACEDGLWIGWAGTPHGFAPDAPEIGVLVRLLGIFVGYVNNFDAWIMGECLAQPMGAQGAINGFVLERAG